MNGVERLEAAIDKLERLKVESTRVWAQTHQGLHAALDEHEIGLCFHDLSDADAELIVTLHRTIDAQLAILRDAEAYGDGNGPGHSYESSAAAAAVWALALPLADAILGEVESLCVTN